jgi:iron complex transport system permease protein
MERAVIKQRKPSFSAQGKGKHVYTVTLFLLFPILLGVFLCGIRLGSVSMDVSSFFGGLFRRAGYETETVILYAVRLPRVIGALLAGVGLSLSGLLLQSITDNALAGPNMIGVNAGAGFLQVLVLRFFPTAILLLPFASMGGAFLATLLILLCAGRTGNSKSSLILAGVALSSVLSAGISCFTLIDDDLLSAYNAFSVGGLSGVGFDVLRVPAVVIAVALVFTWLLSPRFSLLLLGDTSAESLGMNPRRLRLLAVILASASAGAAVSFAGLLGFVGLMVPHIARALVGHRVERLVPVTVMLGGITVILADMLGRVLAAPTEIPVGIVMAMIGAPFLLFLLFRRRDSL